MKTFTEEQVKEMLKQQRELCAKEANMIRTIGNETKEIIKLHEMEKYDFYFIDYDICVNTESIINAILEIK